MTYNGWKMMDKIDVAIKTSPNVYVFNGYVVEHGDKKALESAIDWATVREWNRKKDNYDKPYKPALHTFENGGFSVNILKAAGGSSQGGRLSFLACEVEKDGVKFVIGVNDELLVDLIRNSHIDMGQIKEKVMFVRKGGKPGFIHEGMDAYKEAMADAQQKSDLKKAKKTKQWEIGGVYSTLTQDDICLGEVYDTLEPYKVEESYPNVGYRFGSYSRTVTKYRKLAEPVKMTAWINFTQYRHENGIPDDLSVYLTEELTDRSYISFLTGAPPARTKSKQMTVENCEQLLDKFLKSKREYGGAYGEDETVGRYVRELK